jgi:hypothetical protein
METTGKTRTLRVYVADLLRYPRWLIEREVDFTNCPHGGHYNAFLPRCAHCRFGRGCRWLDHQRTPDTRDATLDELIEALGAAVEYLQSTQRQYSEEIADTRAWIREARRFLRTRRI